MMTTVVHRLALTLGCAGAVMLTASAPPADAPDLEGIWKWSWSDAAGRVHKHVLEVAGQGKELAAREIFDDQEPVRVGTIALDGRDLRFTVVRGERKSEYRGKVADSDHINGTVQVTAGGDSQEFSWTAERSKAAPK